MRDALVATSQELCDMSHITDLASPDLASAVCFCTFMGRHGAAWSMHACELHANVSFTRAKGSTVRVEVVRLPPLTLFALEDNQSSAQAEVLELTSSAGAVRVRGFTKRTAWLWFCLPEGS
jgi:ribosome-binding factor A